MTTTNLYACTKSVSSDQSSITASSDSTMSSVVSGEGGSQARLASSLSDLISQELQDQDLSDFQRVILERAKDAGGVSVSDYESAWSGYRSCMLGKGYKEIKLIKFPNGIY
ncbi:hypothetical protein [Alloscardovia venturai]|uniref:hypothetical protein n=1 Tax=Alloscardovia venturai TaxID=1769421 RepID=UPI00366F3B69